MDAEAVFAVLLLIFVVVGAALAYIYLSSQTSGTAKLAAPEVSTTGAAAPTYNQISSTNIVPDAGAAAAAATDNLVTTSLFAGYVATKLSGAALRLAVSKNAKFAASVVRAKALYSGAVKFSGKPIAKLLQIVGETRLGKPLNAAGTIIGKSFNKFAKVLSGTTANVFFAASAGLDIADPGGYNSVIFTDDQKVIRDGERQGMSDVYKTLGNLEGEAVTGPLDVVFPSEDSFSTAIVDQYYSDIGNTSHVIYKKMYADFTSAFPNGTSEDNLDTWTAEWVSSNLDVYWDLVISELCTKNGGINVKLGTQTFCSYTQSDCSRVFADLHDTDTQQFSLFKDGACRTSSSVLPVYCQAVTQKFNPSTELCEFSQGYCQAKGGDWNASDSSCNKTQAQKVSDLILGTTATTFVKNLFQIDPTSKCYPYETKNGDLGATCRNEDCYRDSVYLTVGSKMICPSATSDASVAAGVFVLKLQSDGNLVIYDIGNVAIWNTGVFSSNGPHSLTVTTDGFDISDKDGKVFYRSDPTKYTLINAQGTNNNSQAGIEFRDNGDLVKVFPTGSRKSISNSQVIKKRGLFGKNDFFICSRWPDTENLLPDGRTTTNGDCPYNTSGDANGLCQARDFQRSSTPGYNQPGTANGFTAITCENVSAQDNCKRSTGKDCEQLGAFWYPKCDSGYSNGSFAPTRCVKNGTLGISSGDYYDKQPFAAGRGACGKDYCEKVYGSGNCEEGTPSIWYKKCPAGYSKGAIDGNWCIAENSNFCPDGYAQVNDVPGRGERFCSKKLTGRRLQSFSYKRFPTSDRFTPEVAL